MTFDEKGMWDWSTRSQKKLVVTFDNYEENEKQLDLTPDEPKSSRRPQRKPQLLVRLHACIMFNDNDPSNKEIINFLFLQIVSR